MACLLSVGYTIKGCIHQALKGLNTAQQQTQNSHTQNGLNPSKCSFGYKSRPNIVSKKVGWVNVPANSRHILPTIGHSRNRNSVHRKLQKTQVPSFCGGSKVFASHGSESGPSTSFSNRYLMTQRPCVPLQRRANGSLLGMREWSTPDCVSPLLAGHPQ